MALDESYLQYPERSYGMDHERYDWSMLSERKAVNWPQGKSLALWVNVNLQFYPLNQQGIPFKVPGGMTMPYPDLRHYSLRDYGNRVGLFRVLKALDQHNFSPTFAVNTRLAERTPYLMHLLKERGDEILCHGYHMDALHYGGQARDDEAELVKRALDGLRALSDQDIRGWLSPAKNESDNTPELLAENGIHYFCDWVNDDMPYAFRTEAGPLCAMPLSTELDDRFILQNNQHSEASYVEQMQDACDFLIDEASRQGGRILSLTIHPWLLGQPHRIAYLERALAYIAAKSQVWSASASEIMDCWQAQQG